MYSRHSIQVTPYPKARNFTHLSNIIENESLVASTKTSSTRTQALSSLNEINASTSYQPLPGVYIPKDKRKKIIFDASEKRTSTKTRTSAMTPSAKENITFVLGGSFRTTTTSDEIFNNSTKTGSRTCRSLSLGDIILEDPTQKLKEKKRKDKCCIIS